MTILYFFIYLVFIIITYIILDFYDSEDNEEDLDFNKLMAVLWPFTLLLLPIWALDKLFILIHKYNKKFKNFK